jgi:hypothetical protein
MKGVYFDQIAAGTKPEEYRLRTPYWRKRIEGKTFDRIVLTKGYRPLCGQLELPWRGYTIKTITHPHFGPEPVEVYAIDVRRDDAEAGRDRVRLGVLPHEDR